MCHIDDVCVFCRRSRRFSYFWSCLSCECVCGSAESLCFYQSKFRGKHLISPGTGSGSGKNISGAPGAGGGADKLPHHINTDNPQLMTQWPDQSITPQLWEKCILESQRHVSGKLFKGGMWGKFFWPFVSKCQEGSVYKRKRNFSQK